MGTSLASFAKVFRFNQHLVAHEHNELIEVLRVVSDANDGADEAATDFNPNEMKCIMFVLSRFTVRHNNTPKSQPKQWQAAGSEGQTRSETS